MGLFDRFRTGTKGDDKPRGKASAASKWADRIERRAQNYDRQEAIQALSDLATPEAAELLLRRFTFHIDPSITDQEEKDSAFRGILAMGAAAIEPVRAFAARAENLAWPMKLMRELVDDNAYVQELLRWLSKWDTEYSKFVDPKVQLLVELEDRKHPSIREHVLPFLHDVNEPARFHAVGALVAQADPATLGPLVELLLQEESVRVRGKIAEGLASQGWAIPLEHRDRARTALPSLYTFDGQGRVLKR